MSAHIIDGKAIAATLRGRIAQEAAELKARSGIVPGLAVVQVGQHPASEVYVRNKVKTARECSFESSQRALPEAVTQEALLAEVRALNANPQVHGILVQLPLPAHIEERAVIHAIAPAKDVDGFHPVNVGKLWTGEETFVPCTPLGCLILLQESSIALAGKHAVIIGRSNIVGKPMAALLLKEHCTVTVAHSRTPDLPSVVRQADIVIAAVGKPQLVRGGWIKPGAAVIDVGINRLSYPDGTTRLVGDVAFDECAAVAVAITPVPGGVGPMTIACLLQNTLTAACATARA